MQPMAFKERGGCEGGGKGFLGSENLAFTLSRGVNQAVMQPIVIDRAAFNQGVNAKYDAQIEYSETAPCLVKVGPHAVMTQPVVYDTTQLTCPTNRSNPQQGDPCHTLAKGGDAPLLIQPTVCYIDVVGRGLQANDELAPTAVKFWGTGGGNVTFVQQPAMVRRLTPLECERLQGFPDNYSAIPSATDSKRYAALGNSMTVNVMKWIGERIDKVDKLMEKLNNQ
jgi:DNA (cytosine-5)-methyltransferase 1